MKINKLLLTTTALVTALCMQSSFAGPHKPSSPKPGIHIHSTNLHVNLSGWLDTQAGFRSQSGKYTAGVNSFNAQQPGAAQDLTKYKLGVTKNNRNVGFDTQALLRAEIKGKTSKGLMYGGNIDVDPQLNNDHRDNKSSKFNRTFIYLQDDDMGRLEMGNKDGASGAMLPTANCVAAATGGVDGDWSKYVVTNFYRNDTFGFPRNTVGQFLDIGTLTESSFHLTSGSLLDAGGTLPARPSMQKPRKITYYTPMHESGIQAGVSYVPDASNVDTFSSNNSTLATLGYKNGVTGGISWKYKIDKDNRVKIGLVGEHASVQKSAKSYFRKLGTVGIGATHMYQDFAVAASFNYLGRSGLRKDTINFKAKKSNYVATLGVAYDIDEKTKVSLTGLTSKKWKNKFYNISLGTQYKLVPGLMPYAEITYFTMKQKYAYVGQRLFPAAANGALEDKNVGAVKERNRGASFIIGTKLAF